MAVVKVFVSFDVENDEVEKQLFEGMAFQSCMNLAVASWSAKSSMNPQRWDKIVKDKINECQMLIILSGKRMTMATNVSKEIAMASELSVPMFGVYVNGAGRDSVLPKGLALSRTIEWDWSRIDEAIRLGLREGRNKSAVLRHIQSVC